MKSSRFVTPLVLLAVALPLAQAKSKPPKNGSWATAAKAPPPFNVVEASISDMRKAMEEGRITSHQLVVQYLVRVGMYEDKLHAVITVNPHALAEADDRDRERAAGRVKGPLHGIPSR